MQSGNKNRGMCSQGYVQSTRDIWDFRRGICGHLEGNVRLGAKNRGMCSQGYVRSENPNIYPAGV